MGQIQMMFMYDTESKLRPHPPDGLVHLQQSCNHFTFMVKLKFKFQLVGIDQQIVVTLHSVIAQFSLIAVDLIYQMDCSNHVATFFCDTAHSVIIKINNNKIEKPRNRNLFAIACGEQGFSFVSHRKLSQSFLGRAPRGHISC